MKNLIYLSAGIIFLFILSLTCFREDQLEKLKIYNESDGDALPLYINVTAVTPSVNGINVSINTDISVQFNDNIDMATVTGSTFSVNNGGAVTGVFSYNDQTKTVSFDPASALAYNTVYTVTLSTGIENLVGDTLASDYSWSFTTVAAPQPNIEVYSPLGLLNSGDTWDYGSVLAGGSKSADFTIENSGSDVLNISGVITGTDLVLFTINPLTVLPASINAGDSYLITVDFSPLDAGVKTALLTVNSNDPNNSAFEINLTGTGISIGTPEIEISRSGTNIVSGVTLTDFGTVPFGGIFQIEFVMKNIGSDNLIVSGFYPSGTDPGFFSTDFPAAPFVLNPEQSQVFHIILTAGSVKENIRAEFVFDNNDSDEAVFIIKLKGKVK